MTSSQLRRERFPLLLILPARNLISSIFELNYLTSPVSICMHVGIIFPKIAIINDVYLIKINYKSENHQQSGA